MKSHYILNHRPVLPDARTHLNDVARSFWRGRGEEDVARPVWGRDVEVGVLGEVV